VAVLPGGTAVSINNINEGNWAGCPTTQTGCNNCAYYVNNCGCTSAPCLQYDGYTVPISVTLDVCPCSSYHWKFAIADAGDCDFDSGIFIESLEACSSNLAYTVDSAASHCDGCNGAAMVNISAGAPPYTYLWSPGGQSTATASNLCPGSYTVSVTDANNCDNPIIQNVSIGTIDTMTLSISSTDASCSSCNNGSITITVNGGAMPYYYYIIPDTSGLLTGNTFINLLPGNYYVCAVDTIGCQACDSVQISYPLSVNASYAKQYFYFYPNPAHNTFTISLKEELGIANWELGIYDVTGRVVHEQKIHSQLSTVNCQLSAGVYFVKVSDGEKVYGQKLVVE
jgi:hypothetical protein